MYIQVRLLKGFQEPLLYKVPDDWEAKPIIGSFVHVPIQQRATTALVEKTFAQKPQTKFTIRDAVRLEQFPGNEPYHAFIKQLASYYQLHPFSLVKRMRQFIEQKEGKESEQPSAEEYSKKNVTLTSEQAAVVEQLTAQIGAQAFNANLLHGVTGSGKTEVYKKLIEHTIAQNKSVVLLLPEVTLAVQFTQLLKAQLDKVAVFGFHSSTSIKEKRSMWKMLLEEKPCLLIGVHLPILLPNANLGLIIIDEEHESGYQEKKHPKINSKEAALLRAQLLKIPILLGSATPSMQSLYNVEHKGWNLLKLHHRFSGSFPTIKKIFLGDKKKRKSFWISHELETAIKRQLNDNKQTIIFLNRRGYSFFVQCKNCSFIFECKNCSVSLTLHTDNSLRCHYCTTQIMLPHECPGCRASASSFLKKGVGTQQIVAILQKLFPTARVARADLDTTTNKKKWQETMSAMQSGWIDILVGTQTITKGYHFPNVTLVGVLWADLNLHFPIYNAIETTLQQLIQVAGRAGRDSKESTVIIQTISDHPVFNYLSEVDYLRFYENEIKDRAMINYPPCTRLVELELKANNEHAVQADAEKLAEYLQSVIQKHNLDIRLLGPAQPPVHKIKNWHLRKIYLKCQSISLVAQLYRSINPDQYSSAIYYTPNPMN